MLLSCFTKILGQSAPPVKCPVGGSIFVFQAKTIDCGKDRCRVYAFSSLDGLGVPKPFYVGDSSTIFFRPDSAGTFKDTIKILYYCDCYDLLYLTGTTYFDSTVKVWTNPYYLTFEIDTNAKSYKQITGNSIVKVFNNFPKAIYVDSFVLITDPKTGISMQSIIDSNSFTSINIDSFRSKDIGFKLSTSIPIVTKDTTFFGSVGFHVHNSSFDTLITFKLSFVFRTIKNGVSPNSSQIQNSMSTYPNPSTGLLQLTCYIENSTILHLHIFDQLGKDIMTIHDGILTEGSHNFPFKLPQGLYYARMETEEGVVTKKIIVE